MSERPSPLAAGGAPQGGRATIRENGREKAYRPLPEAERRAALAEALAAYERGDFFLAHELLEPAWMGASQPAERALHSGLIKLAAGFVHDVRGNRAGVEKNFVGARQRLRAGLAAGPDFGLDAAAILAQLELSLAAVGRGLAPPAVEIRRVEVGPEMNPGTTPTVDVREAERRLGASGDAGDAARTLLVDVREPAEFDEVRAEGALLYPLSTFMARHEELPRDRPLLMICRSGARSAQATGFLLSKGWADVTNVAGGTLAWEAAGLPVRRGTPEPGEGDL